MIARSLDDLPSVGVSHDLSIMKKVMLHHGEVPHLTNFSQATLQAGQCTTPHTHDDMWEIYFVQSGQLTITVDGCVETHLEGSMVTVQPGEQHPVANEGETPLKLIYFGITE